MPIIIEPELANQYNKPRILEKNLITLKGILTGISIDHKINQAEIDELKHWCTVNSILREREPYKSIIATIEDAIEDNILTEDEMLDIVWACDSACKHLYDDITITLQELHGIFHGIMADTKIADDEIRGLQKWINNNDFLKSTYPYDEIETIICNICADGIITNDEKEYVKAFIGQFVDTSSSLHIHKPDIEESINKFCIEGICAVNPNIEIENKVFCFTGESKIAKRKDIANIVVDNGGIFADKISTKTDYLIVGLKGSQSWAYSTHGRKIESAIENRKNGIYTVIVSEQDFWDTMQDYL